jgi:hypothetical protein
VGGMAILAFLMYSKSLSEKNNGDEAKRKR